MNVGCVQARIVEIVGRLAECGDSSVRDSDVGKGRLTSRRLGGWALSLAAVGLFTWSGQTAAQGGPKVTSVSFDNIPLTGDTFEFGARIMVRVQFDENIRVAYPGSPQLSLRIGAVTRQARYWYYAGNSLYLVHIVQREDIDSDGISIPADALSLNGALVTLAGDSAAGVDPRHEAVPDDDQRKVDGRLVSAPRIDGVFFPDDQGPRNGETFGLGEEIAVSVSFDKAVAVVGMPQIVMQVGSEFRETTHWHHGASLGSRGTKITFYYLVRSDDVDADGASVPANAVRLNGGSIALAGHAGVAADLSHDPVFDHPDRKVDGSLGPKVTGVSFMGSPGSGDTYTLGETIQVLVELDQSVRFDRRTRLALTVGERTRQAALSRAVSAVGTSVTFEYLVQTVDVDTDGISIRANAMTLNGAAVTADLSHEAVSPDPGRKVNGTIAVAPKIASVTFTTRPRRAGDGNGFAVYGDTYALGEAIQARVEFDKPVRATGGLQLAIDVGGRVRQASYSGRAWPYRAIFFDYVVQAGDADSDGISIPANALTFNGGAIRMQGRVSLAAELTHEAVAGEHMVDGSAVDAPRILGGRYGFGSSVPADSEAYGRGETIEVSLTLDRRVEISGQPQLALQIGSKTRHATFRELFARGSLVVLFFEYVVQAEDMDNDRIGVPANAVTLNGGAITLEGDATTSADLTHDGGELYSRKIDGSTLAVPSVLRASVSWQPATGGAYSLGETIYADACFSGGVRWSGRPQMAIQVGEQTRSATYHATWLGSCGVYRYRVQEGDLDEDGISIPANSLTLDGGAITTVDASGNVDLTHDATVPTDGFDRRVDGNIVLAPRVTGVSFTGDVVGGDAYGAGQTIGVRVGFDKVLAVGGEPRLQVRVGTRTRTATFARQETDATFSVFPDDIFHLVFEYVVQPGDMDADGISIAANSLDLNGGSLTLEGSPGTAADLSHSAVNPDETRLVDAPDTGPVFSTSIAGQVWLVNEAVSLELPEAVGDGELTYSLSPELPAGLTFDAETRQVSGMPTALADRMAFEYTVTDGDLEDPERATLTFSMSVIAQSASEVGAQSVGDDSVEVAWRGQWSDESRGRLVIEARSPRTDWTVVGAVDPSSGEFIVRGLEPETPYTFRLRFESSDDVARRFASAQTAPEYSEEFSVTTGSYTGPCRQGGRYLCLRDGRFELRADWTNPDRAGDFGTGTAVPVDISDESGLFWFFSPANIELVTKVLDGSRLNGHYWMFFGALSDVEYWLTLRDTAAGGSQRTYHNPPKEICGQSDTSAFPGDLAALLGLSTSTEASSGPRVLEPVPLSAVPLDVTSVAESDESAGQCEATANRLCLLANRFAMGIITQSHIGGNGSDTGSTVSLRGFARPRTARVRTLRSTASALRRPRSPTRPDCRTRRPSWCPTNRAVLCGVLSPSSPLHSR